MDAVINLRPKKRGATLVLKNRLKKKDGTPFNLNGYSIYCQVKHGSLLIDSFVFTITNAANGEFTGVLQKGTDNWPIGENKMDFLVINDATRHKAYSKTFVQPLEESVTKLVI